MKMRDSWSVCRLFDTLEMDLSQGTPSSLGACVGKDAEEVQVLQGEVTRAGCKGDVALDFGVLKKSSRSGCVCSCHR